MLFKNKIALIRHESEFNRIHVFFTLRKHLLKTENK